jgi:hypothetical protein
MNETPALPYPVGSLGWLVTGHASPVPLSSHDIAQRLGVDSTTADRFSTRFDAVTVDWPLDRRLSLFEIVAQIAKAERLRKARPGRNAAKQYQRLATEGLNAARLATSLNRWFSHPSPVCIFIRQLCEFTLVTLDESTTVDHDVAAVVAQRQLRDFRSDTSLPNVSDALLTRLVDLPLDSEGARFAESGLRERYLRNRGARPTTPAAATWRRGWRWVVEASQLLATIRKDGIDYYRVAYDPDYGAPSSFSGSIRAFLKKSSRASVPSPLPGRRPRAVVDVNGALKDARKLRVELTTRFKSSRHEGLQIFVSDLKTEVAQLEDHSESERSDLLRTIARFEGVPSDAAARIVAAKFGLPLRDVRAVRPARQSAGRRERKRSARRLVFVGNIVNAEHALERRLSGLKHPPSEHVSEHGDGKRHDKRRR